MPREHPLKRMSLLPALAFAVVAGTAEAQWTQQSSGTLHDLEEIRFPAPDTGYAVGDSRITSYNVCYTKLLRAETELVFFIEEVTNFF